MSGSMSTGPANDPDLEKGYTAVDGQPDPSMLVAGMDETAQWRAVCELRGWELDQLDLRAGDHYLDLGCGIGDVARAIAPEVQPGGRVVGIDASEAMLEVARQRAAAADLEVTFRTGDALALDEADGAFDVVRSERMLQWVPDLRAAVAEMVRVLRAGGRLCVIDSDWRTLAVDLPDLDAGEALRSALLASRGVDASAAGGRLLNVCRDLGLQDVRSHAVAHLWTDWDPDTQPTPSGLFPMDAAVRDLAQRGFLEDDVADRLVEQIYSSGRDGRFCMSLTMIGVCARRP